MVEPTNRGGARRAQRSIRLTRRDRRRLRREKEQGGRRALRGAELTTARRAARRTGSSRRRSGSQPVPRPVGGRRALRAERRTRGLAGTLGMTFLGAMVPGSGYLYAGRKLIGWVVLIGWLATIGAVAWRFGGNWHHALDLALDPTALKIAVGVLAALLLVWLFVVWTSYRLIRPRERPRWHTVVGNIAVVVICAVFAAPVLRAAQYGLATADFVHTVFDDNTTATAPHGVTEDDPWAGQDRVNVLLLGGDGGEGREGVRTDTVILASIDTHTGKTVTFSLPRNMADAQFPTDSPLHDLYPNGFTDGDPADGEYMLNAIYRNVPAVHPGVLGKSSNEGADAIKQAVEGTLGIPVNYYVLVNLDGFRELVDAMGGVTVNINEPVAVQGCTDCNEPPVAWLPPGPNQHLDGYHALWFARGRFGSDDYERMDRQRCMVNALVKAADPGHLLLRYLDLLKTGKEIVYTDIPRQAASAFVELGLRVKDAKIKSVVFKTDDKWSSADPDFDYMRSVVQSALNPEPKAGGHKKDPAKGPGDACAYHPTGVTVADVEAEYGTSSY